MKKRVTREIPIEPEEPKAAAGDAPSSEPSAPAEQAPAAGMPPTPEAPPAGERAPEYRDVVEHLQRLQAEFANYRRRMERERLETVEFAQQSLVERLVPVLDDFERALASLEDSDSPAAKGLTLIWEKLSKVLVDAGLRRIETEGAVFDPNVHEALTTQPVEPERAEKVLEELVAGYMFRDRLVRPARVCVGVESPPAGDDSAGD